MSEDWYIDAIKNYSYYIEQIEASTMGIMADHIIRKHDSYKYNKRQEAKDKLNALICTLINKVNQLEKSETQ